MASRLHWQQQQPQGLNPVRACGYLYHQPSPATAGATVVFGSSAASAGEQKPQRRGRQQAYHREPPNGSLELEADLPTQLGATFVPGGIDDYHMPEVVAPAPQRVTPQITKNMQDDLQRLELDAGGRSTFEGPSALSPFPKVKLDNVPPTDDEKEAILWTRRDQVLHSNNVVIQLAWARDALAWADIQRDAANRSHVASRGRGPRPQSPKVERDIRDDACNIITYLAQQEHPEALFMVGKWMEFGKSRHRPDKKEAYAKYQRAAELNHVRAWYRMGMLLEQTNDMAQAKEQYLRGIELKDPAASYRMGMMSLLGQHGERKDYQLGLERIVNAAENADEDAPQGAYVYGMLMVRDLGDIVVPEEMLPTNPVLAKFYIERAAFLGFPKAQLKMGQAYELCQLGCDLKPAVSLHYYALAAKQGVPEAALGVSRWFLFGQDGLFSKNEELAYRYAQEAALANLPTGEFAMGYYHEIGIYVSKDINEAKLWYQRAADHGNQDAIDRLESLNQHQTLSKQDHETTTLTRIKSQHGSQRGKRPERLKRLAQDMPTLAEGPLTPTMETSMAPPMPLKQGFALSPQNSPHPSPRPDDGYAQNLGPKMSGLPPRPHSAAPYPDDDRPPHRGGPRSQSTAPYPEDDVASFGRPPMGAGLGGFRHTQSTTSLPPHAGQHGGYDQGPGYPPQAQYPPQPQQPQYGGAAPQGRHERFDPHQPHQQPAQYRRPTQLRDEPSRVGSAPPEMAPSRPPVVHAATAPAKPSQGPATFEEMGIPQGKNESDCIVM